MKSRWSVRAEDEWIQVFQGCSHIFQWFSLILCWFLKLNQGLFQNCSLFGSVFLRRCCFFLVWCSCVVTLSCHKPSFVLVPILRGVWWEPWAEQPPQALSRRDPVAGRKQQGHLGRNFPGLTAPDGMTPGILLQTIPEWPKFNFGHNSLAKNAQERWSLMSGSSQSWLVSLQEELLQKSFPWQLF